MWRACFSPALLATTKSGERTSTQMSLESPELRAQGSSESAKSMAARARAGDRVDCSIEPRLVAVRVVLYVHGVVHRGAGGMRFFVRGYVGLVLQTAAYIVEPFQPHFFARGRNVKAEHQSV